MAVQLVYLELVTLPLLLLQCPFDPVHFVPHYSVEVVDLGNEVHVLLTMAYA